MMEFKSYDLDQSTKTSDKLPNKVESIYVSYDGGRFNVVINGEEVLYTTLAGNDCYFEMNNTQGDI